MSIIALALVTPLGALHTPPSHRCEPPPSRRAVVSGGVLAALPLPALAAGLGYDVPTRKSARYGEEAKMGLVLGSGQGEDDSVARSAISSGIGTPLYDERASVKPKLAAVKTRWTTMNAELTKALEKGAKPVAKSVIDTNMNQLKVDMRVVAKALSGGSITENKPNNMGQQIATFDYNSGQFKLAPLPEKAEAIFAVVNDLYVNGLKGPIPPALALVRKADALFVEWVADAEAAASA